MKIYFNPLTEEISNLVAQPIPANNFIPKWYKDIPRISKKDYVFDDHGTVSNRTVKHCMPFLDAISAGYIQSTWVELHLEKTFNKNNTYNINLIYPTTPEIYEVRKNLSVPISDEYYPVEYAWQMPWIPQLPKGFSALITHPFNRFDLPFYTLTGFVDSDGFTNSKNSANLPFYIKKSFIGTIPIGTPMYQIIPIKRENWESIKNQYSSEKNDKIRFELRKYFVNGYQKSFWHRKQYK